MLENTILRFFPMKQKEMKLSVHPPNVMIIRITWRFHHQIVADGGIGTCNHQGGSTNFMNEILTDNCEIPYKQ